MSEGRPIKKLVQLVTIDTNRLLLSRLFIQRGISLGFNLGEFTADPSKNIYIGSDGLCTSYATSESRQTVNFLFINNTNSDSLFNFNDCIFSKRLYAEFVGLKDKKELEKLMSKKIIGKEYGFCVFPNELEMKNLITRYEKSARKEVSDYRIVHKIKTHEKASNISAEMKNEINEIVKNKIKKVNIDFIWEKQQQMKDFLKRHSSGNLPEDKLLWLNAQLENVSEILMNKENYLWEKVEEGAICKKGHWDIEKTYGEKDTRNAFLVPAYRVYGHYALCCLEIFLDIQDKLPYFVCERCKNLIYTNKKTKQRFCSEKDDKKCFRARDNKQQENYYNKKNK